MIKNPQDRVEAVRPAIEALGGRIDAGYISFGEYGVTAIVEFPDNVSAAAFSISAAATGGVKAFKTTPLMRVTEGEQGCHQAPGSSARPPQGPESHTNRRPPA